MTISSAMKELVEKVRELGVGDYFDGVDYDEIIEMGLYHYGKHIEENLDGIMEDMEIDSESVETWKCSQCGTDCSAIQCPADSSDDDLIEDTLRCGDCSADVVPDRMGNCPDCGEWLEQDWIEEADYLEEDDE